MNPQVLPARPAAGAQFRAEVTGMVLGWWRWPKSSCTPSTPSLKLHPWGCLAMNPLVMWGLETASLFFGKERRWGGMVLFGSAGTKRGALLHSAAAPCSADTRAGSPLLQGPPGYGIPGGMRAHSSVGSPAWMWQSKAAGKDGAGSAAWAPWARRPFGTFLPRWGRGSSPGASCSPVPACQREGKMTPKHHFKLWWDVVARCSFLPLRRVARTPWGRSHAAQRSVGWTCLPAA